MIIRYRYVNPFGIIYSKTLNDLLRMHLISVRARLLPRPTGLLLVECSFHWSCLYTDSDFRLINFRKLSCWTSAVPRTAYVCTVRNKPMRHDSCLTFCFAVV